MRHFFVISLLQLLPYGCAGGGSGDHSPVDGGSSNLGIKSKVETDETSGNTEATDDSGKQTSEPMVSDITPGTVDEGKSSTAKPGDSWGGKFKQFYSVCSDPELKKEDHPEKKTALAIQDTLGGINDRCEDTVRHLELTDRINLSNKGISDISVLGEFRHIQQLRLGENYIRSLEPLSRLSALEILDLSDNPLVQFDPLSGMEKIGELDLSQKKQNLKLITDLIQKYKIEMGKTETSDILTQSQIHSLTWKAMLKINDERGGVDNLGFLKHCSHLTVLNLNYTSVVDLSPLKSCKNLRQISVAGLKIDDFSPLFGHTGLMEIKLTPELIDQESLNALKESIPHMIVSEQTL